MILLKEGFEYKGFKLGQTVKIIETGELCKIIGFNLTEKTSSFIVLNKIYHKNLLSSLYAKTIVCLEGYESSCDYSWATSHQLEIMDNKNNKVGQGLIVPQQLTIDINIISNKCKKAGYNKCLQIAKQLETFKDCDRFILSINDEQWFVDIIEGSCNICCKEERVIKSNRHNLHEIVKDILYNED